MAMARACYVCRQGQLEAEAELKNSDMLAVRCTCNVCGTYDITRKLIAADKAGQVLSAAERLRLSHAIRSATDHGGAYDTILDADTVRPLAGRLRLPTGLDRFDILLSFLADHTEPGQSTRVESWATWSARLALSEASHFQMMIGLVGNLVQTPTHNGDTQKSALRLTLEGWTRAESVRQRRGPGNQAFVAMWFHANMQEVYDAGIKPALQETHHVAYRVDQGAHNNKIDDEIIAQMRRSKLVVVDMTGARPSVYFEAGFAMGLGVPVIWCCNSSWRTSKVDMDTDSESPAATTPCQWTDVLAFDTRQYNFLFWRDANDLRAKLRDRIRALNLDPEWGSSD